jgi:hypothetical protein
MYVHYRDIENDDTVVSLMTNLAVFLYARQICNLINNENTPSSPWHPEWIKYDVSVLKQIMLEAENKIKVNSYYTQIVDDDLLKQRVYKMDMAISRLGMQFCSDRLRVLLCNYQFELLW